MLRILIPCTLLSWIGYAVSMQVAVTISLFGSGVYFTIIILYFSGRNSAVVLNIENNLGILGKWELSPAEAQLYIEKELTRFNSTIKTTTLILFLAPIVLSLIGFFPMSILYSVLLGTGIILFLLAFAFAYKKEIKNSMNESREVVITMAGTKVGDIINDWSMRGRNLSTAVFSESEKSIIFTYYTTTKSGRNQREIFVPFSAQIRDKAEGIVVQMNKWLSGAEPMP